MKIDLLTGVHGGDEPKTIEFGHAIEHMQVKRAKSLRRFRVKNANPLAFEKGVRQVEENMAFAMRHADRNSPIHERREAAKIIQWIEEGEADVVGDVHTTHYKRNEAAYIHYDTSRFTAEVILFLGFEDIIIGEHGIQSKFPNAFGMELYDDPDQSVEPLVRRWGRALVDLSKYRNKEEFHRDHFPSRPIRFWEYLGGISVAGLQIPREELINEIEKLPYCNGGFARIRNTDIQRLGLEDQLGLTGKDGYAINFGTHHVQNGYIGEVLRPMGANETRKWYPSSRHHDVIVI